MSIANGNLNLSSKSNSYVMIGKIGIEFVKSIPGHAKKTGHLVKLISSIGTYGDKGFFKTTSKHLRKQRR